MILNLLSLSKNEVCSCEKMIWSINVYDEIKFFLNQKEKKNYDFIDWIMLNSNINLIFKTNWSHDYYYHSYREKTSCSFSLQPVH